MYLKSNKNKLALLFAFICMMIIRVVQTKLDSWQAIDKGGTANVIAVNDKALLMISTRNSLSIMYDDAGFHEIQPTGASDVDVNDDNDIWMTTKDYHIHFRIGVTSNNLKGTGWVHANGGLSGITTGRYGLVFGHNANREGHMRTGIIPSNHFGASWVSTPGYGIVAESCGKLICYITTANKHLFTSGEMDYIDSPTMRNDWIKISDNVLDVSAYGDRTLWILTKDKEVFEATNISSDIQAIKWVLRAPSSHQFKDIAVTDKIAFTIGDDNHIYVLTGCPIFDFEDNDISNWKQTGAAFAIQPVVSVTTYGVIGTPGKVGHLFIDTASARKDYTMPESSYAGHAPVGTLTSPYFQIQTNMLHFKIGGGNHPYNYVSLLIDDIETFNSSGRGQSTSGTKGKMAMSRYWWDVTKYKGKCGKLRIYDKSNPNWGFTMFDDLRAAPPCLNGMNVTLNNLQRSNQVNVGDVIKFSLKLYGFYTSKIRPLNITISFPMVNKNPLAYIENVKLSTHCFSNVTLIRIPTLSDSGYMHTLKVSLGNLLSDGELQIEARGYDHEDITVVYYQHTIMNITVDFLGEYVKTFNQNITVYWPYRKLAKLEVQKRMIGIKEYYIGDNITLNMTFKHNSTHSFETATRVLIKLHTPPYMSFLSVSEEQKTIHHVSILSQTDTQHTFKIQEILVGERQTFLFTFSIKGNSKWNLIPGKILDGHILVDFISYCPRPHCLNKFENDTEVDLVYTNTFHDFSFSYHAQSKKSDLNSFYTKIMGNDKLFVCGVHTKQNDVHSCNCYFAQRNSGTWYSLPLLLSNISYYDSATKEIFGTSTIGPNIKLYGKGFRLHQILTPQQWNDVIIKSGQFIKSSTVFLANSAMSMLPKLKFDNVQLQWQCCKK